MDSLATINSNNPSSALAKSTDSTGKINYNGLQPGQFFDAKGNVTGTPQTTPWQTGSSYTPTSNNVSTTTISNTNKMDQVPGLVTNLNNVGNKGISINASGAAQYANGTLVPQPPEPNNTQTSTKAPAQAQYTDSQGVQRNADGTQAPIPEGATYNGSGQYTLDGKKYAPPVADTSVQDKQTNDLLDQMKATTDANTADQIANIQQMFELRKKQQTQTNQGQQAGVTNALLMGGVTGQGSSSQYAPISSQNIISAQETYGIQQLANLDAEENTAIAAARQAQQTGNFALLDKKLALIDKQRAEKVAAAQKLNDQILEQNKKLQDQKIQSDRDSAIADEFSSGITDPAKILSELKAKGIDVTAKDVSNTLDTISKKYGVDDTTKLSQDTQEFYKLKSESGGLPVSILHLGSTAEQLAAYLKLKNQASTAGTTLGKAVDTTTSSNGAGSAAVNVGSTLGLTDLTTPLSDVITSIGLQPLASAIVKNEGSSPAGVKNNPGNIKFAGLPGQTDSGVKATDGGTFANYATADAGLKAVQDIIQNAANGTSSAYGTNPTLQDFINKYTNTAPVKPNYSQYGLLANVPDFNPTGNKTDKFAALYLNNYLKNGTLPTYTSIFGRTTAAGGLTLADVQQRANDLFFNATGSSLPDVNILKSNKALISANNKLENNLNIQEGTINKNFKLSIDNLDTAKLNQDSQPINGWINNIKNILGDPAVAQYFSQNATLQSEAASLLALKNSGGTTVHDKLEAAGLIQKNATEDQQKQVLKTLLQEAENAGQTIKDTNSDLYTQIDPLEQDSNNPNRTTSKDKKTVGGSNADDFINNDLPGSDGSIDWSKAQ